LRLTAVTLLGISDPRLGKRRHSLEEERSDQRRIALSKQVDDDEEVDDDQEGQSTRFTDITTRSTDSFTHKLTATMSSYPSLFRE
jgi:hypothetical protein